MNDSHHDNPFSTSTSAKSARTIHSSQQHYLPQSSTLSNPDHATLLSRLPFTLDIILKEYTDYNTLHSSRKQKKLIPSLFYQFYQTDLCKEWIVAGYEYMKSFLEEKRRQEEENEKRSIGEREMMDGSSGNRSRLQQQQQRQQQYQSSSSSHTSTSFSQSLQSSLHTLAECWGRILLYRSNMNRNEVSNISSSSNSSITKKSDHFLNDNFDGMFFETLYLLCEYVLEWKFMDVKRLNGGSVGGENRASDEAASSSNTTAETSNDTTNSTLSDSNSDSSSSQQQKKSQSSSNATSLTSQLEDDWRVIQHEYQRIYRTKHFNHSMKLRRVRNGVGGLGGLMDGVDGSNGNSSGAATYRNNGLNHIPLGSASVHVPVSGGSASFSSAATNNKSSSSSTSYRNLSTFALFTTNRWRDEDESDDVRALSHLPGQYQINKSNKKGLKGEKKQQQQQQSILECLDLRSPLVAAVLPNPRNTLLENTKLLNGKDIKNGKRGMNGSSVQVTPRGDDFSQSSPRSRGNVNHEFTEDVGRDEEGEWKMKEMRDHENEEDVEEATKEKYREETKEQSTPVTPLKLSDAATIQQISPPRLTQPQPPSTIRTTGSISPRFGRSSGASAVRSATGVITSTASGASTSRSLSSTAPTPRLLDPVDHLSQRGAKQRPDLTPTLDDRLASKAPLIKITGNRISLADFKI